jgi:hypothetical protein
VPILRDLLIGAVAPAALVDWRVKPRGRTSRKSFPPASNGAAKLRDAHLSVELIVRAVTNLYYLGRAISRHSLRRQMISLLAQKYSQPRKLGQ